MEKVRLADKLALIDQHWRPKVVGELNGQEVKLAKLQGEFPWHTHVAEDELFLVLRGRMTVEFRGGRVDLAEGEMVIVPRGTEHRTLAADECSVLIFEPAGVRNTGDVVDPVFTAPVGERL